ncbi:MAG: 50S ribosomal protein L11 methyltransferase, partial [Patescibacteria group bacterium]
MIVLTVVALLLVASVIAALLAVYFFAQLLIYRAPFVRTPTLAIDTLLAHATITPNQTVYDLGCGDASVLIAVEQKFGCRTVGYEVGLIPYLQALRNIRRHQVKTVVRYRNFFKENLSQADVVFCFLIKSLLPKVGAYLQQQLKPGSQVICSGYP